MLVQPGLLFAMRTALAIALLTGLMAGCILPIPTPHGKVLGGTEVRPSDLDFLQPGITTKADIVQRLGQPTILWRDENTLVYRWVQRKGLILWAVAGAYQGGFGAADITAEFAFMVKLDAADRFVVSETVRKPVGEAFGQFLLDWRDAQRQKANGSTGTQP